MKYILGVLQPVFYILPQTSLFSQYPRTLPRELVRDEVVLEEGVAHKKKAGRPSKSEKAHRMRAAVTGLERWLEKCSYPANNIHNTNDPAGAAGMWRGEERTEDMNLCMENEYSTHIMLSQRPMATLNSYRNKKSVVVQLLEDTGDIFVVSSAYWQLDSRVIILFPGERSKERLSATTPKIAQFDYKCLINEVTARNEDQVFSRETPRQDT